MMHVIESKIEMMYIMSLMYGCLNRARQCHNSIYKQREENIALSPHAPILYLQRLAHLVLNTGNVLL